MRAAKKRDQAHDGKEILGEVVNKTDMSPNGECAAWIVVQQTHDSYFSLLCLSHLGVSTVLYCINEGVGGVLEK